MKCLILTPHCVFFIWCIKPFIEYVWINKTFSMSINVQKKRISPSIFLYLCFDRKLTEKPYYTPPIGDITHYDSNRTLHIYPQTQSNFWLFLDKPGLLDAGSVWSGSVWSWCQPDLFFLPALELGQRSAQPKPPGAFTNLSSPSVFHVAWGTLAGSLNELTLPPLLPPPAIAFSLCVTCLSHRGLPVFTGLDFSPQVECCFTEMEKYKVN